MAAAKSKGKNRPSMLGGEKVKDSFGETYESGFKLLTGWT